MGRLALLLTLLLPSDQPNHIEFNSSYHKELYFFAERGMKNAYTSAVVINAFPSEGGGAITGSGNYFRIKDQYFIMTAAHVVDNMGEIFITERSGFSYGAKVKHMDYFRDIAILAVDSKLMYTEPIDYRSSKYIEIGKEVFYCGNPNNQLFLNFHGRVAGTDGQFLLINNFAWPGSSGSIVFNKEGKVVGSLSAVSVDAPTGLPVLIPHIVRVGPTLNYTRKFILGTLANEPKD
jgi:S1-C subfamily serine protease